MYIVAAYLYNTVAHTYHANAKSGFEYIFSEYL